VGGVAEGFCAAVELSDAERDQLLELCRQRLDAFRMQRGEEMGCLLTQKPAASGTGAAVPPPHPDLRLDQSPGAHPGQGPLRMLRRRLLLSKPRTKGPWKWTTSCPETMAGRTTSSTCRPSASAAMSAHSKAQAVDQLFNRAAQLAGHVLENLPQGADP